MRIFRAVLFVVLFTLCIAAQGIVSAADLTLEGTFSAPSWKNDRPNTMKGEFMKSGPDKWEGEFVSNWQGTDNRYKGSLSGSIRSGKVKGVFIMQGSNRRFEFTASSDNYRLTGDIYETTGNGNARVGALDMRASGKLDDFSEFGAEILADMTGINKEKILEYYSNRHYPDDLVVCCVAAKAAGGDLDKYLKEKKRWSTNYLFLKDGIKLEKQIADKVSADVRRYKERLDLAKKRK